VSTRFPYAPTQRRPIPAVVIELIHPSGQPAIASVSAYLDSGADTTVVPLPLLQRLGLTPLHTILAKGFGAAAAHVGVYQLRVLLPGVGDFLLNVIGHSDEPRVLVGRDILNRFRVTFDGPNQLTEFH
jgi:hypothetical protein